MSGLAEVEGTMTRESAVVRCLRALTSRRFVASVIVALLLASCATAPQQPTGYSGRAANDSGDDRVMAGILTAISLPLFIPFKAAVCALTIAFAVPATAITTVTDPEGRDWQRRELAEGFAGNCGNWLPSF
jgi:hypothetical protein